MNNIVQQPPDFLYTIKTLTITDYLADHGCYSAEADVGAGTSSDKYYVYELNGSAPYGAYGTQHLQDCGYSKNLQNHIQEVRRYPAQSRVLCCVPVVNPHSPVSLQVGFILGEIATTALSKFEKPPTHVPKDPVHVQDMGALYQQANKINQTQSPFYFQGHLEKDVIPGDYVLRGNKTKFTMDNYALSVGTDNVYTTYSEATGVLLEKTRIKETQDILSKQQTFLIDDKSVVIRQESSDPRTSFLDCMKVSDDGKLIPDEKAQPYYTSVEAKGDLIDGTYKTLYNKAAETAQRYPILQEHIGIDGTYTLNTVKSMKFSKSAQFAHVECSGPLFQNNKNTGLIYQHNPNTFTQTLAKGSELQATDIEFINKSVAERQKLAKNPEREEHLPEASIDFLEDGSIRLKDAWGSYILLSHGNIQIHAINNAFVVSGRDYIQVTGGTESHCANKDIQLQSTENDIIIHATKGIKQKSNTYTSTANAMELSSLVYTSIQSPNCNICTDKNSQLTLGSDSANISIAANSYHAKAQGILAMTVGTTGFILQPGGQISNYGNVTVTGNLSLVNNKQKIKINDKKIPDLYSSHGSIFVTTGGLYAKGIIGSSSCVWTKDLLAVSIVSKSGDIGEYKRLSTEAIDKVVTRHKGKEQTELAFNTPEKPTNYDLSFSINTDKAFCQYIAESWELDGGTPLVLSPEYYIYPGKAFWTENGLSLKTKDGDTVQGFSSYKFNPTK